MNTSKFRKKFNQLLGGCCAVVAVFLLHTVGLAQDFRMGNRPASPGFANPQAPPSGMYADTNANRDLRDQKDNGCMNRGPRDELNLSETQMKQLAELKLKFGKSILPLQNELAERSAQLRTLSTGEKVLLSDINKAIDEIGNLQNRMMKLQAALHQDFRKILNDEQRQKVDLDFHPGPPREPGSLHSFRMNE